MAFEKGSDGTVKQGVPKPPAPVLAVLEFAKAKAREIDKLNDLIDVHTEALQSAREEFVKAFTARAECETWLHENYPAWEHIPGAGNVYGYTEEIEDDEPEEEISGD